MYPKVAIKQRTGDELKCVYVGQPLNIYDELKTGFDHLFLQPCYDEHESVEKTGVHLLSPKVSSKRTLGGGFHAKRTNGWVFYDKFHQQHCRYGTGGGMDSTSLLLHLLSKGYQVTAISFNYGQKHVLEIERASALITYLHQHNITVRHHIADLTSATALFNSNLLLTGDEVPRGHYEEDNMKATVVPNRNALFSSLLYGTALSIANVKESPVEVVLGVHSGDHAIYPDCRPEFYHALEHAFAIGNWDSQRVSFTLPYLMMDKAGILRDAEQAIDSLGLDFDEVFRRTLTSISPMQTDVLMEPPVRMLNEFLPSTPLEERTQ